MHKHYNMKQNKAAILPFLNCSNVFDRNFTMDIKNLLNPAYQGTIAFVYLVIILAITF